MRVVKNALKSEFQRSQKLPDGAIVVCTTAAIVESSAQTQLSLLTSERLVWYCVTPWPQPNSALNWKALAHFARAFSFGTNGALHTCRHARAHDYAGWTRRRWEAPGASSLPGAFPIEQAFNI